MGYIDKLIVITWLLSILATRPLVSAKCTDFVRNVPTFMDCKYRCHCKQDVQCDETTGQCPDGCELGWMGPGCQYQNLANYSTYVKVGTSQEDKNAPASFAADGDDSTCTKTTNAADKDHRWFIYLDRNYTVTGIIIKFPPESVGTLHSFTVHMEDDNLDTFRDAELCYRHVNSPVNISLEIMCQGPIRMNRIRITNEKKGNSLQLCEVEIYGGRSITFNKPSSQSSTYISPNFSWNSSRALDGRVYKNENDFNCDKACSATKRADKSWWQVDLRAVYTLTEVKFFGRLNLEHLEQFQGFKMFYRYNHGTMINLYQDTSNSTNMTTYQPLRIPLDPPIITTELKIMKFRENNKDQLIAICELLAFGECEVNHCGWDCNTTCMCSSPIIGWDKITGTCPTGCQGRWTGEGGRCNNECELTNWGPHCDKTCGHCEGDTPCNVTTGHCPEACSGPWIPPYCTEECTNSTYGTNCSKQCGACTDNSPCNITTGVCTEGCEPGFLLPMCDTPCPDGFYGKNCTMECGHCDNGMSCDKVDGHCPTKSCQPGYHGNKCDEACPDGLYGKNCTLECGHCENSTSCDKVNGHCPNKHCQPGYHGSKCDEECQNQTYGLHCHYKCGKCINQTQCNIVTGECSDGCDLGYHTDYCNETCPDGFYGDGCTKDCGECENKEPCNKVNGNCPNKRCSAGYQGNRCRRPCENSTYGNECQTPCGFCSGEDVCHHVTGVCPFSCQTGYEGPTCTQIKSSSSMTTIIVALIAILLCCVLVLIVVFLLIRRRKMSNKKTEKTAAGVHLEENQQPTYPPQRPDRISPVQDQNEGSAFMRNGADTDADNVYGNMMPDSHAINIARLRVVANAAKSTPEPFYEDFKELPNGLPDNAINIAKKQKGKNKYSDMLPYDFNRVLLPKIHTDPNSTYINASYINGYRETRKYIAAQGPIRATVNDIWRMVWSHEVTTVVMLTNCFESGKSKCEHYWPDDHQSQTYDNITVQWMSSDVYTDFCITTFKLSMPSEDEPRTIIHFHYIAWPDKGVPDTSLSLVQFWRAVRNNTASQTYPWIVHCSAGVGRTGTFIGLDFLYDQGSEEKVVNVKGTVNMLRQQRVKMVQTQEQYVLLHEAVADVLDPIGHVYKKEEFTKQVTHLITTSGLPTQALHDEYQAVCESYHKTETVNIDEEHVYSNMTDQLYVAAKQPINLSKSRSSDIYPDDLHRPMLSRIPIQGHNDFINAVFMSTFRQKNKLILTQVPLAHTVEDFVRMLWDTDISTWVLLEHDIENDCCYWPLNSASTSIGPLQCELIEEIQCDHYIIRTIKYVTDVDYIQEKEKTIRQFHFTSWYPERSTPESTGSVLALMSAIQENVCDNIDSQIVFQCLDGAEKSGLFSVLWCVLEQMKTEREIGIAETVRVCRLRRRQVINDMDQYAFCYKVADYLESAELYSNVL